MLEEHLLNFKTVEAEDVPRLRSYIEKRPKRICDFTAGCIYMWGQYYATAYALDENALYLRVEYSAGYCYAILPVSGSYIQSVENLYKRCQDDCRPLKLCAVIKEEYEALAKHFGARISASTRRNWSDYVYLAEAMREFSGKKYHRQRNHINAFIRDNPDWRFEPIGKSNFNDVVSFYDEYRKKYQKEATSALVEAKAVNTVLSTYDKLDLPGGILYVGDEVVGFSIGEVSGDTLFVHIEKASTEYRGSYQMLVREFAREYAKDPVIYINREDDAGDEGLRASKLSYRPIELIDKYLIAIE
ncbi:MAG: DUF2156 domain-containing protein [Clostridiales bacterium]|nr:DUF2156 domain-containing protein [Clostridiales bacterium]